MGRKRVLLADDTLIARAGWSRILERESDIEVCGEAAIPEAVLPECCEKAPDSILLDLVWNGDGRVGLEIISALRQECPLLVIVAVSVDEHLLLKARRLGAHVLLGKDFTRDELIAAVKIGVRSQQLRVLPSRNLAECLLADLRALDTGRSTSSDYERLIDRTMRFLFPTHLSHFQTQSRHHDGEEIWDLIALNVSQDPFWELIRSQHRGSQIIFEMKNVKEIRDEHVLQLNDYLGNQFLQTGVLVSRKYPSKAVLRKLTSVRDKFGSLILCLADDDVAKMVEDKADGNDPTHHLQRLYVSMVRR